MTETIEVDEEVLELLKRNAEPFVDTPNSVVRRLLGLDANGDDPSTSRSATPNRDAETVAPNGKAALAGGGRRKGGRQRASSDELLPRREYELPILRYLVEHDGRAPSREVVESVGKILEDRLTDIDRETLQSGDVRWENRVAFTRLRLVEEEELDANAPRGTWQITDKGRARVAAS